MILGDLVDAGLADIRTGPFGTQLRASDYVADGRPVLNVRNVGFGEVRAEKLEFVDEATAHRLSGHILQEGDIVFGRKGAVERHAFIAGRFVGALQGSDCIRLRILDEAAVRPAFVSFALRTQEHREWIQNFCSHGATMASLNQEILRQIQLPSLGLPEQDGIIRILSAIDELIENNRRRIEMLEQMAQAIYREWFVRFRFPGHENTTLVDSALGPIPEGWSVSQVSAIASSEPNAVTGGPFGSRLGRKDYVAVGVPVIRGMNLSVGGGFNETDLVYVTDEKADELRGCLARRGDIVITQRGTLGQVGLIPARSRFSRYLLSQSQMKVTVANALATPEFLYAQLRTPATTDRFIAQAMSSGVPHVNLALLRDFDVVVPPIELQRHFTRVAAGIAAMEWALGEVARTLTKTRSLLLPKLVSGQIDVSHLGLDTMESSVA